MVGGQRGQLRLGVYKQRTTTANANAVREGVKGHVIKYSLRAHAQLKTIL